MDAAAKYAAYHSGALPAVHRLRNRHTLTVLMFHRVLPAALLQGSEADPEWSVTTTLFEAIVSFALRHYSVVDLDDVVAARAGRAKLPPRALLISFDDGWRDNLDHALPILRRHGVPAVLFAATDAIEDGRLCWWQDVVLWALRSGRKERADLCREAGLAFAAPPAAHDLSILCQLGKLATQDRDAILLPLMRERDRLQDRRQMLDPGSLRELAAAGVAVGVHGAAHLPLTALEHPEEDLEAARERIALHLGGSQARTLSFPHGRYDGRVAAAARGLGFQLQFTSDAIINECPSGYLETDLVGRIPVFAKQVRSRGERLSAERLSTRLFLRPRKILTDSKL